MKKEVKRLFLAIALLAMTVTAGCVPVVVAGAAGYAYYKGTAEKTYDADFAQSKEAVLKVFSAMEINLTTEMGDKFTYKYNGKTDNDTAVEVVLKSVSSEKTSVSVRFGVFGSKEKSGRFFGELDKFMPKS